MRLRAVFELKINVSIFIMILIKINTIVSLLQINYIIVLEK